MAEGAGPLTGRRVLVPRSPQQAAELSERIRAAGGEPVEAPTILIGPGDDDALRAAVRDLDEGAFAALCLTSPNGAAALAAAIAAEGLDARSLARTPLVAAVGSGTAAALWQHLRVRPDLVPPRATTRSLAEAFPPGEGRVLLPRADIASRVLTEVLSERGYQPEDVVAYRTEAPDALPSEVLADLADGRVDLLVFGSSSTVRNFVALTRPEQRRGRVVSIGPVTSATCRELGLEVAEEAEPHDLDGLIAACERAARAGDPGPRRLPPEIGSPAVGHGTRARLAAADAARVQPPPADPDRPRGGDVRTTVGFALGAVALAAAWRFLRGE